MTTLGNPHLRTPDWQVTAVFDPDGEGQDFAYTVGLFERELPELHLWARPSLGDDPGADWKFSPQDCCRILNELAWQLIDGELNVGDSWERPYDDGLVTCRFRLDPPGDRDELEAFGIAPGALVLPVRWSLHRRPMGRPRPLTKRGLQRARSEYAGILAGLGDAVVRTGGWDAARGVRAGRGVRPADADGGGAGGRVLVRRRDHVEQSQLGCDVGGARGLPDVAGDGRRRDRPGRRTGRRSSARLKTPPRRSWSRAPSSAIGRRGCARSWRRSVPTWRRDSEQICRGPHSTYSASCCGLS